MNHNGSILTPALISEFKDSLKSIGEAAISSLMRKLQPTTLVYELVSVQTLVKANFFHYWLFEMTVLEIEKRYLTDNCMQKNINVALNIRSILEVESSSYLSSFVKKYMELQSFAKSLLPKPHNRANPITHPNSLSSELGVFSMKDETRLNEREDKTTSTSIPSSSPSKI